MPFLTQLGCPSTSTTTPTWHLLETPDATTPNSFCVGGKYELYGYGWWGPVGPTSPVYDRKIPHAPERGVGRPPRADQPPSEHEGCRFLFPPPFVPR
eukprot:scaffold36273_cov150-Isochrysis_galbana.AAC.3